MCAIELCANMSIHIIILVYNSIIIKLNELEIMISKCAAHKSYQMTSANFEIFQSITPDMRVILD